VHIIVHIIVYINSHLYTCTTLANLYSEYLAEKAELETAISANHLSALSILNRCKTPLSYAAGFLDESPSLAVHVYHILASPHGVRAFYKPEIDRGN
jgi:hypothetical protein